MWRQRKPLEIDFTRLAIFLLASGKASAAPVVSLPEVDYRWRPSIEECAVGVLISLTSMGDWFINDPAESCLKDSRVNPVDLAAFWGKARGLKERYQTLSRRLGGEPLDMGQGVGQRFADVLKPINDLVAHFGNAWQLASPPSAERPGEPYRPAFREVSIAFASEAAIAFVDASVEVARRVERPHKIPDDFRTLRRVAEVPSADGGTKPTPPMFSEKVAKVR